MAKEPGPICTACGHDHQLEYHDRYREQWQCWANIVATNVPGHPPDYRDVKRCTCPRPVLPAAAGEPRSTPAPAPVRRPTPSAADPVPQGRVSVAALPEQPSAVGQLLIFPVGGDVRQTRHPSTPRRDTKDGSAGPLPRSG